MTRTSIAALILALSIPASARAGGVLLPHAPHEVKVSSWKAKGGLRNKAGMRIHIDKAHPESTIVIQRQKRSSSVELSGEVSEEQLVAAAHGATQWHDHMTLKTENESTKQPHITLTSEPEHVMRPGSRFRVKYTTRDKQTGINHGLIVDGKAEVVDTVHDMKADDGSTFEISKAGKNSKSARAWAHVENIFVTAPETDEKMVKDGHALLHDAKAKTDLLDKLRHDETELSNSGADPTRLTEIQNEIPTVETLIQDLTTRGNEMVAEGARSKVRVLSVGGLPVNARVSGANVRLQHEGGAKAPTFSVSSHPENGMIHQELDAVDHDKVTLGVHFEGENTNVSSHTMTFRVGEEHEKAAFTYQGRKYYRVQVGDRVQHNVDPAE
jgi:hypothetical protein